MKKAFTLIEVLMVMSISILFLGVSFSGYRDFSRRQEVLVAKRQVMADLSLAQKNAVTGNKPAGCTGTLVGYAFEVVSSGPPATYQISAVCTNPLGGADLGFLQFEKSLTNNSALSQPITNPVIFHALNKGTNLTSGTIESLTVSSLGHTQIINITWVGEIN